MRPKKDPGIRQEAFIRASTELFMEKGYEAVSIRDVLDAVADKTASPSVFYYYFPSKDALYHACVKAVAQAYLETLKTGFAAEGKTIEQWMLGLVSGLEKTLIKERNLIMTGGSTPNRLFILDMREQMTEASVPLWKDSLISSFGMTEAEAKKMAWFLAGGVGEMMFAFLLGGSHDAGSVYEFTEDIVQFVVNTMNLQEGQKMQLMAALKTQHGGNGNERI